MTEIIGHRGDSTHAIENTLHAFELAAAAGADGVEFDVRRCADGALAVFHDADLRRLLHEPRRLRDITYAELRRFTFPDGSHVPTLGEALETCRSLGFRPIVELKEVGCEQETIEAISAAGLSDRAVVSSFSTQVVRTAARSGRIAETALILGKRNVARCVHFIASPQLIAKLLGAHSVHVEIPLASPAFVKRAHKTGLRVFGWTVRSGGEARRLLQASVDGVIADDPRLSRSVIASSETSTSNTKRSRRLRRDRSHRITKLSMTSRSPLSCL